MTAKTKYMNLQDGNNHFQHKKQNKGYEKLFFSSYKNEGCDHDLMDSRFYNQLLGIIKKSIPRIEGQRMNLLEAGCGTGEFGPRLLNKFNKLNVMGVDIVADLEGHFKSKSIKNYKFISGDIEDNMLFGNDNFDIILCPFVLHHFPSLNTVFQNFEKWLKPGGIIILVEPNGSNPILFVSKIIRKILEHFLGKEYLIKKRIATPNETDHPVATYVESLKVIHFKPILIKTGFILFSNKREWHSSVLSTFLFTLKYKIINKISFLFPGYSKGDYILIIGTHLGS